MDYIREELLRQISVLSVLMIGGRQGETEEIDPEEAWVPASEPISADREKHRIAWQQETIRRFRGRMEDSGALFGTIRASGFRSERDMKQRMPGRGVTAEEPVELSRIALYERASAETTADARKLSRSIQRDTRRYDGGFSIY